MSVNDCSGTVFMHLNSHNPLAFKIRFSNVQISHPLTIHNYHWLSKQQ